ncbi:unnamed protein product [Symbiodinium sp. CCMP2456]|nr:unnamed protein product [Symbiodinium sp. CCMP2456]
MSATAEVFYLPSACHCGAVRFLAPIARERSWLSCHCSDCRRVHGSAFSVLCPLEEKDALGGSNFRGALKEGPLSMCAGLAGSLNASVRRHFCQTCGSTCLVALHMEGKVVFLLAVGILSDKHFPNNFKPEMEELATQSPAPFGPLAVRQQSFPGRPQLPATGSCLCGKCRFRTTASPREFQHCHCSMCRKLSGSAYQTWTPVKRTEVEWLTPTALKTLRSSRRLVRSFLNPGLQCDP